MLTWVQVATPQLPWRQVVCGQFCWVGPYCTLLLHALDAWGYSICFEVPARAVVAPGPGPSGLG